MGASCSVQPPSSAEQLAVRTSTKGTATPIVDSPPGVVGPSTPASRSTAPGGSPGQAGDGKTHRRRGVSAYMSPPPISDGTPPDAETAEWLCKVLAKDETTHLFDGLTSHDLASMVQNMTLVHVPKGGVLYKEHAQNAETAYVCASGILSQVTSERDTYELAWGVATSPAKDTRIGKGKLFGDTALLFDKPRSNTIIADEDASAWQLHRAVYVQACKEAASARVSRRNAWLRQHHPFFTTADDKQLSRVSVGLRSVALADGEELGPRWLAAHGLKEGACCFVESGLLRGGDSGAEHVAADGAAVAVCPSAAAYDALLTTARDWEEARQEYVKAGHHLRSGAATSEVEADLMAKAHARDVGMSAAAEAQASKRRGKRRSSVSATAVAHLEQMAALGEPGEGSGELRLVAFDAEHAPPRADGKVRVLLCKLPRFTSLVRPMHRLMIDWEDLREHFASQLLLLGAPEEFDELYPLLSEQRTYKRQEVILKQGDRNSVVFLVLEGECSVNVMLADGSVVGCASRRRGDFFGERTTLGMATHNSASVTARSERCVCAVYECGAAEGSADALPAVLRECLEHTARQHVVPEQLDVRADLEHVADLGQGGFGSVMLTRHKRDGRPIALKCLLRSAITKPKHQEHIVSEKQLMVELRHPFLVNLIGTSKDSERLFLAMEYIIGGELFTYMANHHHHHDDHLPLDQTRFIVASVCLMIEHIQGRRFLYRDLKPENLMIGADGYLKLIDFGFAKELVNTERTYTCVGTLEYMAPEVLDLSQGHGFAADWWSIGILMYECLHGNTPWIRKKADATDRQIIAWIKDKEFRIDVDPSIPELAEQALRAMACFDADERATGKGVRRLPFFDGFDWMALLCRTMPSPLEIEAVADPFCTDAFEETDIDDDGLTGDEILELDPEPYVVKPGAWDAHF